MGADTSDLNKQKSAKASAEEGKATAEGDLASTIKNLANADQALATANGDCMTTAADHEATMAARTEELKVISTAEKILKDPTSGAVGQTCSLLRVARIMRVLRLLRLLKPCLIRYGAKRPPFSWLCYGFSWFFHGFSIVFYGCS